MKDLQEDFLLNLRTVPKDFKLTLKAARVNRGLHQREVAEKVGKNLDTIAKYEKDSTNIPRWLGTALAELYNVPEDLIFFGKESDFTGK